MTPDLMPTVPVSVGELVDKVTILTIKVERLTGEAARANVAEELGLLTGELNRLALDPDMLASGREALLAVNRQLWEVEDFLRICESRTDFSAGFVEAARSVYRLNDQRAQIKKAINHTFGSRLIEQKSYAEKP